MFEAQRIKDNLQNQNKVLEQNGRWFNADPITGFACILGHLSYERLSKMLYVEMRWIGWDGIGFQRSYVGILRSKILRYYWINYLKGMPHCINATISIIKDLQHNFS